MNTTANKAASLENTSATKPTLVGLMRVLDFFGGFALALTWFGSAVAHIANPYYFLSSVYQYQLVGADFGQLIAIGLPTLQLILAACLITRQYVQGALMLSVALLVTFLAAQVSADIKGLSIDCGCFGASHNVLVGSRTMGFTFGMLGVTLSCAVLESCNRNLRSMRS